VEDLDRQILAALAEDLLALLAQDSAGAVMRVYDAIADLELNVLRYGDRRQLIQLLFR
jgi:hypothetical protein